MHSDTQKTHEVQQEQHEEAEKIREHNSKVWLVNTGWSGGPYGVGSRFKLKYTRAIIDAIHDGSLAKQETKTDSVFGVEVPVACEGVPSELLDPKSTWYDGGEYDLAAQKLANLFHDNFKKYEDGSSEEIRNAGPVAKAGV